MKKIILLMTLSLLTAGRVFCQTTTPSSHTQGTGINLSLWKGISTQQPDSTRSTCFNIGVFSWMNQLDGVGFNILAGTTHQSMNGLQIAGLANICGENTRGWQIAGICHVNGGTVSGATMSGLVNISNSLNGFMLGGLANITGADTHGVAVSGLFNMTGHHTAGITLSGLINIAGRQMNGLAAAGLLNIAGEKLNGVQMAGLLNIAGEKMNGVQIAAANVAVHAKGLQIGLVNYYHESMEGFQLGLVNANQNTRIQLMAFGGNDTKFNLGARFKNELFYTILGCGTHYLNFGHKFSGSLFYRAGLEIPLFGQFHLSGDLGYQHIETFRNKHHGFPARLYGLQARVNVEYRLNSQMGLFLTGGYGGSRYYTRNQTFDKGVIIEGGIILFKY